VLIFSTNYERFALDLAALADLAIEDLTAKSIPYDFRRSPRIHRCYRLARG
jgi:23S rRNA (guanine2445-N2)-methyltransferase / 23S rRNA (guanine2069-N7)-methyltransferase